MSKNIILCLDGTWSKPDEDPYAENEETNVRNLWEILDKTQPKRQVVYYDEGVGSDWYNRLIGGISGWGLAKNIREAYFELCKHYEHGDNIFIFGFSRGAYTARSLAGMIYSCGLLNKDQLTEAAIEHALHAVSIDEPEIMLGVGSLDFSQTVNRRPIFLSHIM